MDHSSPTRGRLLLRLKPRTVMLPRTGSDFFVPGGWALNQSPGRISTDLHALKRESLFPVCLSSSPCDSCPVHRPSCDIDPAYGVNTLCDPPSLTFSFANTANISTVFHIPTPCPSHRDPVVRIGGPQRVSIHIHRPPLPSCGSFRTIHLTGILLDAYLTGNGA
jgi:hypothetical protein